MSIAQGWIKTLGVKYEGGLDAEHAAGVTQAFRAWRKASDPPKDAPPELGSLIPRLRDRTWRAASISAERVGTQNYVYVPGSAPLSNPKDFISNPNHGLYNFSAAVNLGEFYVSVGDRTTLCSTVNGIWKDNPTIQHHSRCDDPEYLSASRPRDMWGRVALSVTLTAGASQIPRYQSSMILANNEPAAGRGWNKSLSGTFDPILLFRSATEWQSWAGYYHDSSFEPKSGYLPNECREAASTPKDQKRQQACFDRVAKGPVSHRILTTLLPKVVVKTYTPFDFVKTGTTFAEPPGGGRALYDVNVTWDLKKVVPSAATRVQGLKAYQAFTEDKKEDKLKDWKQKVQAQYEALSRDPQMAGKDWWWDQFTSFILSKP